MDNDYEIDQYDDDDSVDEDVEVDEIAELNDIHQQVMMVTTEGITNAVYNGLNAIQKQNIFMCNMCTKYFRNDMKINWDGEICMHCFFWLHYSEGFRTQIDGLMGITIAQYILKCRGSHKIETCTKNTNMGGCFICDNLNGLYIDKIKTPELVNTNVILEKQDIHISDDESDINGGVSI